LGGAGLAGAALLGVACCGGQKDEGLVRLVLSHGEGSEALRDQIRKFNQQNRGAIEVTAAFVAGPRDAWVMGQVPGRDMVTLQTCTPIPAFDKRLIVRADRI
jgi:hypothetical protein